MYNKLLIKDHKTGKVDLAIHANLVTEKLAIRLDDYDVYPFVRFETELNLKEIDELIEYLQEFKRLLREK